MHIGTIAICKDTNKDPAVVNASALDDASIHRPQLVRQINRCALDLVVFEVIPRIQVAR